MCQGNLYSRIHSYSILLSSYCDIDTQGNKALVMKQYLSDEKVCPNLTKRPYSCNESSINAINQVSEIDEILEMKVTHRKNLTRREKKFGSASQLFGITVD